MSIWKFCLGTVSLKSLAWICPDNVLPFNIRARAARNGLLGKTQLYLASLFTPAVSLHPGVGLTQVPQALAGILSGEKKNKETRNIEK